MTTIRGLTWGHTRGYVPMVAVSQAWMDSRPDLEITWDKRSLWAFGEGPIDDVLRSYDLLVMDHPLVGYAADRGLLTQLDAHLPAEYLKRLSTQSMGPSYHSYTYQGHQWALPIDAAAQVSAFRPDLLRLIGEVVPRTWDDVLSLARRTGRVAIPLRPIDTLSTFFTLCAAQGEPPLRGHADGIVSMDLGLHVLGQIRDLLTCVAPSCLDMTPIDVLNKMAYEDEIAYVPFTFGYSNYGRRGYAPSLLSFTNIPAISDSGHGGSTLGGAGLALSTRAEPSQTVLEFMAWVAGDNCQSTLYIETGGQPGNRAAWESENANTLTNGFFRDTLATLHGAYLRPTYNGIATFQTEAGDILTEYLRQRLNPNDALGRLNAAYRNSLTIATSHH